jgi:hypothetical protein
VCGIPESPEDVSFGRKDLNEPYTAVCGIPESPEDVSFGRKDLNEPPTSRGWYFNFL